jgi:23S rRNA pseudouridine1911/1915/1917 synthase
MEVFEVKHDGSLVDALTRQGGYTTRTKARKAIKNGAVKVDGVIVKIPSTLIESGAEISHDRGRKTVSRASDGRVTFKSSATSTSKPPFDIVYEDHNFLAYVKPSGWITASPKPQLTTSYSKMKNWLEAQSPANRDLHFINKLEKDVSGICLVAKNLKWREHLQNEWEDFRQGIYILVEGHLPSDDELQCREEDGEKIDVAYRTMRATQKHTLLKVDAPIGAIHLIMPSLRREGCIIIGKGKTAPDPLKREGVHMFALEVIDLNGIAIMVKSRVPRDFLNLMKGGDSPEPAVRRGKNVKFNQADRGSRPLKRRPTKKENDAEKENDVEKENDGEKENDVEKENDAEKDNDGE